MRKLLTILFSFFTIVSLAQNSSVPTPPLPNWNYVGSPTYLTDTRGVHRVAYGFIHARYADTATANTNAYIKSYPGLVIVVGDTVYMRNSTATQWLVTNGSGGGGGSGTVTNVATGFGLLGGPVTTTGTIEADTTLLGTKQWVYNVLDSLPTITATEGITAISNNVMLGGILTSPASLLTNRRIDLNGKALYFTKGLVGTDTTAFDIRYTPFVVDILDSLTVDENFTANYDLLPKHGGLFKRTIRYYPPAYKSINRGGFKFILQHEAGDSALIRTDGGDYQYPLMGETRLKPLTGHTGQTVFRVGNGSGAALRRNEGVPSVVANMFIDSTSASSYVRVNGHLVGFRSYLVAAGSSAPDSINAVVHYSAGSFINSPSWVRNQYAFAPDIYWNRTDSAFLLFDTARNASSGKAIRAFWRAKTRIGATNDWTSPYQFAVGGSSLFEDSIVHGQRLAVTDTTGVDIMVRDRSTGILKYITADNLGVGGGGGSSLFPTTGTGTATGAVIGDLDGNTLSVVSGGNDFLLINPDPNDPSSSLMAFHNTDNGNFAQAIASSSFSESTLNLSSIFNDGVKEAYISIYTNSSSALISYTADTHTFTGAVITQAVTTAAGTAGLYLTSGTLLTTPEAGAIEYDGNTAYVSTATGRGYWPSVMFARLTSNFTLTDNNSEQPAFSSGLDVWTLQGNTTYEFEGAYTISCNATNQNTSMGFTLGGGASLTSIYYTAKGSASSAINVSNSASVVVSVNQATATSVTLFNNSPVRTITFKGMISMNAGGTVTPFIKFSAAPGGTNEMIAGSYIKFTPIGTNVVQSVGPVQ